MQNTLQIMVWSVRHRQGETVNTRAAAEGKGDRIIYECALMVSQYYDGYI